jgi:hypothetical protein
LILIGSATYAALARREGRITYLLDETNPGVRTAQVGFDAWSSVIPAPDYPEYVYREVQGLDGQWVRDGYYSRRNRDAQQTERGTYRDGKREGPWGFWDSLGGVDGSRSGMYVNDVRVGPVERKDLPR